MVPSRDPLDDHLRRKGRQASIPQDFDYTAPPRRRVVTGNEPFAGKSVSAAPSDGAAQSETILKLAPFLKSSASTVPDEMNRRNLSKIRDGLEKGTPPDDLVLETHSDNNMPEALQHSDGSGMERDNPGPWKLGPPSLAQVGRKYERVTALIAAMKLPMTSTERDKIADRYLGPMLGALASDFEANRLSERLGPVTQKRIVTPVDTPRL